MALVRHGEHVVAFAEPSAVALFLNRAHRSFIDAMAIHPLILDQPSLSRLERDTRVYDYFELIMTAVVSAYTAIEAFANEEIPETYQLKRQRKRSEFYVVLERRSIEREVSLDEKLTTVLPETMAISSPKGTKVWQDYVALRRLRDRIVHLKSRDRQRSRAGALFPQSLWADLLNPQQPSHPITAKNIIVHFRAERLRGCPF